MADNLVGMMVLPTVAYWEMQMVVEMEKTMAAPLATKTAVLLVV